MAENTSAVLGMERYTESRGRAAWMSYVAHSMLWSAVMMCTKKLEPLTASATFDFPRAHAPMTLRAYLGSRNRITSSVNTFGARRIGGSAPSRFRGRPPRRLDAARNDAHSHAQRLPRGQTHAAVVECLYARYRLWRRQAKDASCSYGKVSSSPNATGIPCLKKTSGAPPFDLGRTRQNRTRF